MVVGVNNLRNQGHYWHVTTIVYFDINVDCHEGWQEAKQLRTAARMHGVEA